MKTSKQVEPPQQMNVSRNLIYNYIKEPSSWGSLDAKIMLYV